MLPLVFPVAASVCPKSRLKMSNIRLIPQGKGGVGKSFVATILAEYFISKDQKAHCIDIAVCDYLLSNKIVGLLEEMGHQVFIHTLLTGGDSMADTLGGFIGISNHCSNVQLVVWHNEFYGSLFISGKPIDEETLFTDHCQNVFAQIHLPKPASATFGQDLIDLRRRKLTLAEGIEHTKFSFMTRHRLKVLRDSYFAALEQARL
ncbi:MAG: hypothetical protein HRT36_07785 [Alphaproteobacteria bacterium]|nr:hypothetical protein [Alphaproteobacteria bacterium]